METRSDDWMILLKLKGSCKLASHHFSSRGYTDMAAKLRKKIMMMHSHAKLVKMFDLIPFLVGLRVSWTFLILALLD